MGAKSKFKATVRTKLFLDGKLMDDRTKQRNVWERANGTHFIVVHTGQGSYREDVEPQPDGSFLLVTDAHTVNMGNGIIGRGA